MCFGLVDSIHFKQDSERADQLSPVWDFTQLNLLFAEGLERKPRLLGAPGVTNMLCVSAPSLPGADVEVLCLTAVARWLMLTSWN